jgi:ketopantoate reductase
VRNGAVRRELLEKGMMISWQSAVAEPDPKAYAPVDPDIVKAEELKPATRPAAFLFSLREAEPDLVLAFEEDEILANADAFIGTQPDISFSCTKADSLFLVRSQIASQLKGLCFFVSNGFWLYPGIDLGVMYGGGFSQGARASLIREGRILLGRVKSPHADFVTSEPEEGAGTLIYRLEELEMMEELCDLFDGEILRVEVQPDIYSTMLRKAVLNCLVNPLAALSGHPNGALLMGPVRALAAALAREIVDVLIAASFVKAGEETFGIESLLSDFDRICRNTASNCNSMLIDRVKGRPGEIKHLNGMLLGIAQRYGIAMPLNSTICALLQLPPVDREAEAD